jgi:hypothetical protein
LGRQPKITSMVRDGDVLTAVRRQRPYLETVKRIPSSRTPTLPIGMMPSASSPFDKRDRILQQSIRTREKIVARL